MIVHVAGRVVAKELDRVEILTKGGVGYELLIPLSVYESLPKLGEDAALHTHLVVKEDGWQLFGFSTPYERRVFDLVRTANGVGPALALSLLSSLSAPRVVRAVVEKDTATLQSVPRVGKKKAEQLVLDLATKMRELSGGEPSAPGAAPAGAGTEDAIRALVSLGYSLADAERGVRSALDAASGPLTTPELIRAALPRASSR